MQSKPFVNTKLAVVNKLRIFVIECKTVRILHFSAISSC